MNNEELSREQIVRRYGNTSPDATTGATRRSPFKFLDSYEAADADIFFGRDYEIAELLGHFHSYGHVLIYGESGSGKTSLVQCGLRSRIPAADALFIPLRVHAAGLSSVCHQIRESAAPALGEPVEDTPQSSLVDTLREVSQAASRPVVLFFDQFEELFIFHDADTRRRFADDLASLRQARLNVKVIIGVRQDYLAHLSELEDTVEGLFDNRFWLRRMSRENAAEAVVNACSTCDVKIDDDLAESIIHRLDPSGHGIELPYLQVVMDRLYRQAVEDNPAHPMITAEEVQKLGDIADILGSFLVEEVAKLPAPDTGRQILKAFVTREATRRTLDRDAVAQESAGFGVAIPPDVLEAHLNQLASVRILREIADSGTYELRHDALAATVSGWISEVEKELIEVRDNLVNRFNEYEARGQHESALLDQGFLDYLAVYRERLRPLLSGVLSQYLEDSQRHVGQAIRFRRRARQLVTGVVGSIILGCLVFALWQWNAAAQREQEAQENLAVANHAVETMLTKVGSKALKDVPQMESIRTTLLEEALGLYEGMLKRTPADVKSRFDVALAHYRVAQVLRIRLAEGDKDAAETHYKDAIQSLKQLTAEDPRNFEYPRQLANSFNYLGVLLRKYETEKAKSAYDEALQLQTQLVTDLEKHVIANPGDDDIKQKLPNIKQELARTHYNQGILLSESGSPGDKQKAKEAYQEAADILTELIESESHAVALARRQQELARAHNLLGTESEGSDATAQYDEAIRILKELLRNDPNNREYKFELAAYYNNLAEFKEPAAAVQTIDEAIELFEELNAATPSARKELANGYNTKGTLLHKSQPEEAAKWYEKAVEIFAPLNDSLSDDTDYQQWFFLSQANIATLKRDKGELDAAFDLYSRAIERYSTAVHDDIKKREEFFFAACFTAPFILQLDSDKTLSEVQRDKEQGKYRKHVFDFLERALKKGYDDVDALEEAAENDDELAAISEDPRFRSLLEKLRKEKK